jgi:hypothetical protein
MTPFLSRPSRREWNFMRNKITMEPFAFRIAKDPPQATSQRRSIMAAKRALSSQSRGSNKIEKVMKEYKEGKLHSGRSGRKVTRRKQAVAVALSEARQSGARIPGAKARVAVRGAVRRRRRRGAAATIAAGRARGAGTGIAKTRGRAVARRAKGRKVLAARAVRARRAGGRTRAATAARRRGGRY